MARSQHPHQAFPKSPRKRLEMRYTSAVQSQRPPRRSNTSTLMTKAKYSEAKPDYPQIFITPAEATASHPSSAVEVTEFTGLPLAPGMSLAAELKTDVALLDLPDSSIQDFAGDIDVNSIVPSRAVLDRIVDLPVFDQDGQQMPFKSLYWPEDGQRRRTMIIFIRHFLCGNCREYLRALAAQIPPSSLPPSTFIAIVGCGSPSLISSYIAETGCLPYPIFADPSKRLYSFLGMHRTLSMGSKDPAYIQQSLTTSIIKSIVQGIKRVPKGDAMQGGDMRLNGGEFLFEVDDAEDLDRGAQASSSSPGNSRLSRLEVTFCHRMRNTRDHTEISHIRTVLQSSRVVQDDNNDNNDDDNDDYVANNNEPRNRRPRRRWTTASVVRSLSSRSQRLRSLSLSRSATRDRPPSVGSETRHGRDQSQQRSSPELITTPTSTPA